MSVRAVPNIHRLTFALLAVLALPATAQQATTQPPASGDKVKTLDQVTVTGSRIRRAEAEEALPITSITKDQIDAAASPPPNNC